MILTGVTLLLFLFQPNLTAFFILGTLSGLYLKDHFKELPALFVKDLHYIKGKILDR